VPTRYQLPELLSCQWFFFKWRNSFYWRNLLYSRVRRSQGVTWSKSKFYLSSEPVKRPRLRLVIRSQSWLWEGSHWIPSFSLQNLPARQTEVNLARGMARSALRRRRRTASAQRAHSLNSRLDFRTQANTFTAAAQKITSSMVTAWSYLGFAAKTLVFQITYIFVNSLTKFVTAHGVFLSFLSKKGKKTCLIFF